MIDLRPSLLPVRDQGQRSTCLAFAASACHEHRRGGARQLPDAMSVETLYWAAKQLDGDRRLGTTLSSVTMAAARTGQAWEHLWPYVSDRTEDVGVYEPPEVAIREAGSYRFSLESIDSTWKSIVDSLTSGYPVCIGLVITDVFYTPIDGEIPAPSLGSPELGLHAVVGVGLKSRDGHNRLIIRNSWGTAWGDAGHGYLAEGYLQRYCRMAARVASLI
jgi:C1A family cysteine protease